MEQNEVLAQQNVLLKTQIEKMQARCESLENQNSVSNKKASAAEEVDRMRSAAEAQLDQTRKELGAHKEQLKTVSEKLKEARNREHDWEQKYALLREESDERVDRFRKFPAVERISTENGENLKLFQEVGEELADKRSKFLGLERENVELSEKYQKARREAD
eukprot:g7701.t1